MYLVSQIKLLTNKFSKNSIFKLRKMTTVRKSEFPDTSLHEQLPRDVKPIHYDIKCYDIDYKNNLFKGIATIDFEVINKTKSIILNQKFLNFDKVIIKETNEEVKDIIKNDENETVKFNLTKEIDFNNLKSIQIIIEYNGIIRNDMAGFYTSNYKDNLNNNEIKYILATQFESTDARSAFPCFDEPNCKATFTISIEVLKNLQVLSNMPIDNEIIKSNKKIFKFKKTPKMSTYLVAWAIGEFEFIEGETKNEYNGKKLPIKIYTIPGQSSNGKFALETASIAVDYLSKIFEIDYPLPKLDLLAVPQFGANAMENWGLIMFRSTALLYDEKNSSLLYKQKVSYVVSHEIAHSWFGNYCTMNWWSDLWLNESFATYVGWLCVEFINPKWDVFTDFISGSMQTALDLDSLKSSHPIEVQVFKSNEIDEIFDAISYLKGGSVVRMVSESIGVKLFLKGVSNYLKKYPFGNAKSDDLWDSISEVSGQNITKLIEPWIRSVGYPALIVKKSKDGENIIIKQRRFLSNGFNQEEENINSWWIPNDNMVGNEKIIKINEFNKLNKDTIGFYRVFYESELFEEIISKLNELSDKDKIGLIADTSAGVRAGIMPTSQFLNLIYKMKNENHVSVWNEIIERLNILKNAFFDDKEISEKLILFSKDLYKNKFEELIKDNDDKLDFNKQRLLLLLFEQAGISQFDVAISKALELYKNKDIKPYFRQAVYRILLSNPNTCNEEIFEKLLNEVRNPTSIDSREVALRSLGSINKVENFLPRILELFFDGSIPEMDYQFLTITLSNNNLTKIQFWEFFKINYLKFRNDVSMWTLDRLIKGFTPKLVSKDLLQDIETFFKDKDNSGYEKGLLQGLESIKTDVEWSERDREDILEWFKNSGY